MGKAKSLKLIFVDISFLFLDFVITGLLFKLWFWLFDNKIILTILVVITLLGLTKQVWKALGTLGAHYQSHKDG